MSQSDVKKIAERTFTSNIIREYSAGGTSLGEHESTMTLYLAKDATGFIEWDIPGTGDFASIGLWFDVEPYQNGFTLALRDYDGVFSLPTQAIEMLTDNGILVGDDFR